MAEESASHGKRIGFVYAFSNYHMRRIVAEMDTRDREWVYAGKERRKQLYSKAQAQTSKS